MSRLSALVLCVATIVSAAACDKVPLLAPTQSTINLTVSTTTLAVNGTAQVIATVTEQPGTPVQNGTLVTFTGSLGSFDPPEATTVNGKATSSFRAGTQSGTAKIGATSGSAKATEVEVKIGGAAAEQIALRADPATVPATGGTVQLVAVVSDVSGNALPGVPVVFTTDAGNLAANSVVTDGNGEARTTLTTNRAANVKASVGSKTGTVTIATTNLSVSITPPQNPIAGLAATFTITPATTGSGSGAGNPIRSVVVDWGDGTVPQNLGAVSSATTVSHVYSRADTYVVTATVTDTSGQQSASSTTVIVQRGVINVSFSNPPATGQVGTSVSFTVAVTNANNIPITGVNVRFGDGQSATLPPSGGTAPHTYAAPGTYTVTATAIDQAGNQYPATHIIRIDPATAFNVTLDAAPGDPAMTWSCFPASSYPKTCNTNLIGFGDRVQFTAVASTGFGSGTVTGYEWNFGDGTIQRTTSNTIDHVFTTRGTFTVTVTVATTTGNGSQYITIIVQ